MYFNCSTVQDCSGRDFGQSLDTYFHFDVFRSTSHGHIEVLKLKENHAVDFNQLTIRVNPIICHTGWSLRKHAYTNILKILPPKNENFQINISDIFQISTQNIDCGYSLELPGRGGSNEYPQSMFLSRNKKYNVYPCKPQFYYIKVGFKGVKII